MPAGWQELETATGETFASGSTYQIQAREEFMINYSGVTVVAEYL